MTPSEQPQRSESESDQDAKPASTTTQTVEDNAEHNAEHQSSSTSRSDDADRAATSGAEEEPSHEASGEIIVGSELPPPWQRATAPPSAGTADSGESEPTASPLPDADTQKIPRPAQESPTASFGVAGGTATTSAQSAVSFAESVAGRSSGVGKGGTTAKRPNRGPRRASLQVKRVDPWSVLKLALVLSVALFFVWMIAVAVLYGVLDGMGVWDQLNGTFTELTQPDNAANQPLISAGRVFISAAIVGGINAVLMTALATVAAFIYNVAADLAGGIEVTLSERE